MSKKHIELTSEELEAVVSSLLFTSSVSIIGTIDEKRQNDLVDLATKLKNQEPDMGLKFIEFIKEDEYEDMASSRIYEEFKDNLVVTTFEGMENNA